LKDFLSEKQVADFLGVSKKTIQRLRAGGRLPFYSVGRSVRISRNDIDTFLLSSRNNITHRVVEIN
jgi:excisionase family DNA binding protein